MNKLCNVTVQYFCASTSTSVNLLMVLIQRPGVATSVDFYFFLQTKIHRGDENQILSEDALHLLKAFRFFIDFLDNNQVKAAKNLEDAFIAHFCPVVGKLADNPGC